MNEWESATKHSALQIKNKNYGGKDRKNRNENWKKEEEERERQNENIPQKKMVDCYSKKQAWGIFETLSLGKQLTRNTLTHTGETNSFLVPLWKISSHVFLPRFIFSLLSLLFFLHDSKWMISFGIRSPPFVEWTQSWSAFVISSSLCTFFYRSPSNYSWGWWSTEGSEGKKK